jgi:hypothetical protein
MLWSADIIGDLLKQIHAAEDKTARRHHISESSDILI